MSSEIQQAATRFQEENRIDRSARPVYHATPPTGWMNDPNGFSIYDGKIHLFYQYHPYKDIWGPMHWGHCTSADYISWSDLPVALAPDEDYDASGCFSGSALSYKGQQALVYTGCNKRPPGTSTRIAHQQQCLALGDGIDYVKSPKNPVIPTAQLQDIYEPTEFRDPKVWEHGGSYYMVTVAKDKAQGLGHVLLFRSDNLEEWQFLSVVLSSDGTYGTMWECPDLFTLDDTEVLLVSCMFGKNTPVSFHDGFSDIACLGKMDWKSGTLHDVRYVPLDQGADFYAAQTLKAPDGRRIMIAWMQAWENFIKPSDQKWHGMMAFPRELQVKDGTLVQNPTRELELARVNPQSARNVEIAGGTPVEVPQISGRVIDMTVNMTHVDCMDFTIAFAATKDSGIQFTWTPGDNTITCSRKLWGVATQHVTDAYETQTIVLPKETRAPKMRFLVDTASVELFIDDGVVAFSATYYAPMDARNIEFSANGTVRMDIEKYDIDPAAAAYAAERTKE